VEGVYSRAAGGAGTAATVARVTVQIQQRQTAAPYAAGIQRLDPGLFAYAFEGCPVPEQQFPTAGLALGMAEPGRIAGWRLVDAFLAFQVEAAVSGTEAHASEVIGDHPQARHTLKRWVPLVRLVAVHAFQEGRTTGRVAQHLFDFGGAFEGFCQDRKSVV